MMEVDPALFGVMALYIYRIDVWGPSQEPSKIIEMKSEPASHRSIIFAPNVELANQFCYIISTRNDRFSTNYQEIDRFSKPISCAITYDSYFQFSEEQEIDFAENPILPPTGMKEIQKGQNELFQTRWEKEDDSGEIWTYAPYDEMANLIALEFGEAHGCFDLTHESVKTTTEQHDGVFVFWDADVISFKMTPLKSRGSRIMHLAPEPEKR